MPGLYRPSYKDKKTGQRRRVSKWYAWYQDLDGKTVRVPLSEDKNVATQLLGKIIHDLERGKHGLSDPFAGHRATAIAYHLADYHRHMLDSGTSEKQADLVLSRCKSVASGMKVLSDITVSRVQSTVAKMTCGVQTKNFYLQAMRQFCRWLVVVDRLERYPLGTLRFGNVSLDVRHKRRALTLLECQRLTESTGNGTVSHGLTGQDRRVLYAVALGTGLRARELASLSVGSFDLPGSVVVVEAGYSKRRRRDTLPLHPELVAAMRPWLDGREGLLWPGRWFIHAARMIREDLAAAGIEYSTREGVADFHSLRHTFVSHLVRSGVQPKLCQALARHSTIRLTMDRYAHVETAELRVAIAGVVPLAGGLQESPLAEGEGSKESP